MMMEVLLWVTLIVGVFAEFDPTQHPNWKLITHDICGQAVNDRIIGGREASMSSYPWIARLGFFDKNKSELVFGCGGAVISTRVIISAAHCVHNLPSDVKIGIIRLGEHDTKTNPDCKGTRCADPYVDIKPSEVLIPEDYVPKTYQNDIALIRLSEDIKFTSFIRPICLLSGDLFKKDLVGDYAEVAGWGIYDIENPSLSTVLKAVSLPILKNDDCKKRLPSYAEIGPKQLCGGGNVGEDSCSGDSGGPFMKVDDGVDGPRYFLVGVVSFGVKRCGKTNSPAVYTKISAYTKWILDNLEKKTENAEVIPI